MCVPPRCVDEPRQASVSKRSAAVTTATSAVAVLRGEPTDRPPRLPFEGPGPGRGEHMTNIRRLLSALVVVPLVCLGSVRAGAAPARVVPPGPRPIDYAKIAGLSKPVYENIIDRQAHAHDGRRRAALRRDHASGGRAAATRSSPRSARTTGRSTSATACACCPSRAASRTTSRRAATP